jgi:hypothetical protein
MDLDGRVLDSPSGAGTDHYSSSLLKPAITSTLDSLLTKATPTTLFLEQRTVRKLLLNLCR